MRVWLQEKMKVSRIHFNILHCEYQIFCLRLIAVKKWLKRLFFVALLIIGTGIFLPETAKNSFFYIFIRQISFSYLTSLLFYFIVVHIPKEDKKLPLTLII